MNIRESEALEEGGVGISKETICTMIDMQKKKEAYIQLNNIISDKGITNIKLVEDDPIISGGAFRDGNLNGKEQSIDVGDASRRKDWSNANGAGAIIHELVEAYTDQVTNSGKPVIDRNGFIIEYLKGHLPALISQAKVGGYDEQYNQGVMVGANLVIQVFNMKTDTDASGNKTQSWVLTEYTYEGANNTPQLLRSGVAIENVKKSADGSQVDSYTEKKP